MAKVSIVGNTSGRDTLLDCLKGLAILLVILGHEFQGMTPNFDQFWPFRIVYSFHMPLFMFAAGMVTALGFGAYLSEAPTSKLSLTAKAANDMWSKTQRLLPPFLTFAIVTHFWRGGTWSSLPEWMWSVVKQPDLALWFLPVLWLCHIMLMLSVALMRGTRPFVSRMSPALDRPKPRLVILVCAGILLWLLMVRFTQSHALHLARLHFPYYLSGIVFYTLRPDPPPLLRLLPYLAFATLMPFWFREGITPIVKDFLGIRYWLVGDTVFRFCVALSGIFIILDLANLCSIKLSTFFQSWLSFIGKRTLDIYALHFYFLGFFPFFIAPLILSLVSSIILRFNRFTSGLCFGQWQSVIKQRRFSRIA